MAIKTYAEGMNLRFFLSLTLDPSKIDFFENIDFAVPYLRQVFNKFREYLRRAFGEAPHYICVMEFTAAGMPHLHILIDRWIDQRWISETFDKLGGGRICDIRKAKLEKVANYISKYLTKDILLSAPKGSRRITCSRSIKLFPAWVTQRTAQEVVKQSVWGLLSEQRMSKSFTKSCPGLFERHSLLLGWDEETFLKSFELIYEDFRKSKGEEK